MDLRDEDVGEELELYPPWKQAIITFRAAGFSYGDIVEHAWLYDAFGMKMPLPQTSYEEGSRIRLAFLGQFERLRAALLEQDQIDLVSKPGMGYELIHPAEQSKLAYGDGMREVRNAISRTVRRITYVNPVPLSTEQRKEHADYLARAGMLRSLFRQTKRLLPGGDDE